MAIKVAEVAKVAIKVANGGKGGNNGGKKVVKVGKSVTR